MQKPQQRELGRAPTYELAVLKEHARQTYAHPHLAVVGAQLDVVVDEDRAHLAFHDARHLQVDPLLQMQHVNTGQGACRRTGAYNDSTTGANGAAFSPPSHGPPSQFARARWTQPTLRARAPCARARPRRRCAPGRPLRRHLSPGAPRPRPSQQIQIGRANGVPGQASRDSARSAIGTTYLASLAQSLTVGC